MKRILSVLAILVLIIFVSGTAFAQKKPSMKLKASFVHGEGALVSQGWKGLMDEVTKLTDGRITFERFWGGTIMSPAEVLDIPGKGIADIAGTLWIYVPGKVPLGAFQHAFPFNDPRVRIQSKIQREMYEMIPAFKEELAKYNIINLVYYPLTEYNLLSRTPIKTLADLKGKKIGHTPPEYTAVFRDIGAVSVISPAFEFYERLDRGVVDAVCIPIEIMGVFKSYEVAKHYTVIGLNTPVTYGMWMNMGTWKKLSEEDKKIFLEAAKRSEEIFYKALDEWIAKTHGLFREAGVNYYDMPKEDVNKWAAEMIDIPAMWARDIEVKGLPGWKIVDTYISLSEREGWKWPRKWGKR